MKDKNAFAFEWPMDDKEAETYRELERNFASLDEKIPEWARYLPPDSRVIGMIRLQQDIAATDSYDYDKCVSTREVAEKKIDLIRKFDEGLHDYGDIPFDLAIIEQAAATEEAIAEDKVILNKRVRDELEGYIDEIFDAYADYYDGQLNHY